MAIGKKLRFEIFRRDNFACRYCGATAAGGAVLEADHVVPRSKGGRDVPSNLLTACESCNAGKSDTPIGAQLIEDVPQEAYRRACTDRGVLFGEFPEVDAAADATAEQILNYLRRKGQADDLLERAKDWVVEIDEEDPTPRNIAHQAAFDAFLGAEQQVASLSRVIDDLIFFLHPLNKGEDAYSAARESHGEGATHGGDGRFTIWVGRAVVAAKVEEQLNGLSPEEISEWVKYGIAVFGEHPWGYDDDENHRLAAKVHRAIQSNRHYPAMCRATGEKISDCPHMAKYRVWVTECGDCAPGSPFADLGHEVCQHHLNLMLNGAYTGRSGDLILLRDYKAIEAQQEMA